MSSDCHKVSREVSSNRHKVSGEVSSNCQDVKSHDHGAGGDGTGKKKRYCLLFVHSLISSYVHF